LSILSSEAIINRLATDITKDNLLKSEEDPIQPIMDIVHGSIMKDDIATTRVGLKAVTERLKEIIDRNHEREISSRFLKIFRRIWRHSLNQNDEDLTEVLLINLTDFGKSALYKELWRATNRIVIFLGEVGEAAAKKRQEDATKFATEYLLKFGKFAPKNCPEYLINRAAESLAKITLSSEKVVKKAIGEFDSELENEEDRKAFQKFKKLYEEELEKLRAEQQK
jgi:hypothetical protein